VFAVGENEVLDRALTLKFPTSYARQVARSLTGSLDLVVGATIGAAWFCAALWHVWPQPIVHDARGYAWIAQAIVHGRDGSDGPAEALDVLFNVRLMGYPLFLSPFVALGLDGASLRLWVATTQLIVFWSAVLFLRFSISRLASEATARRVTLGLLVLPFPYFLAVEVLTESASVSLAIVAGAASLRVLTCQPGIPRFAWSLAAGAAAGAAMAIRTDNVFIAWMCTVAMFGAYVRPRDAVTLPRWAARLRAAVISAGLMVLSVALFRVPQYLLLKFHTGAGAWDTPRGMAVPEFEFGVGVLKWATGISPISGGFVYRNPFLTDERLARYGSDPLVWYRQHPLHGLALVATKWFALVDQDVPFTFNDAMPGRPNIALFVVNHAVVMLGILGLIVLIRTACSHRSAPEVRWGITAFLVGIIVWLGTHALPHAESRYGLPALVALGAASGVWLSIQRIRRYWRLVCLLLAAYLPIAWTFSNWLITFRSGPI